MGQFDEIVGGGPYAVYVAPAGSAIPGVAVVPKSPWVLMGTNGPDNMAEDGISINQGQTLNQARVLGQTLPVKAWRSAEEITFGFSLLDLTPDTWNRVLHGFDSAIFRQPPGSGGPVGAKAVTLDRGGQVAVFRALIRLGLSPYDATFTSQFEIYRAYQSGDQSPTLDKSNPAMLQVQFTAMYDRVYDASVVYRAQYAAALP